MNLDLTSFLMQMPTARRLLELVKDDLRCGRSVLGLFPEGIDSSRLRSELSDGLAHWHLQIHEIFISQLNIQTPAGALAQALGNRLACSHRAPHGRESSAANRFARNPVSRRI